MGEHDSELLELYELDKVKLPLPTPEIELLLDTLTDSDNDDVRLFVAEEVLEGEGTRLCDVEALLEPVVDCGKENELDKEEECVFDALDVVLDVLTVLLVALITGVAVTVLLQDKDVDHVNEGVGVFGGVTVLVPVTVEVCDGVTVVDTVGDALKLLLVETLTVRELEVLCVGKTQSVALCDRDGDEEGMNFGVVLVECNTEFVVVLDRRSVCEMLGVMVAVFIDAAECVFEALWEYVLDSKGEPDIERDEEDEGMRFGEREWDVETDPEVVNVPEPLLRNDGEGESLADMVRLEVNELVSVGELLAVSDPLAEEEYFVEMLLV